MRGVSGSDEDEVRRREFLGLTAAGISVLAAGCGADDVAGEGDTDSSTGGTSSAGTSGSSPGSSGGEAEAEAEAEAEGSSEGSSEETGEPDGPDFDPEAIAESVETFPRTVMAGEMQADSFMVAGFVSDGEDVDLHVWEYGDDNAVEFVHSETITPDAHGFLKVTVQGLQAGQWYSYALFRGVGDGPPVTRSLIGQVKTALGDDQNEPVTIAIGACVGPGGVLPDYVDPKNPEPMYWGLADQASEHMFDVYINLGDQGYFDQVWAAGGEYERYLEAWGAYHGGSYRDIFPLCGILSTWDDHEVTNNGDFDPWTTDPTERERMENAIRAYYHVLPIDAEEPFKDPLWRSFQWGQTVEFILLDCRYEREADNAAYISADQLAFLLERLQSSPCHFKCILNSVPFSNMDLLAGGDRWQGYPASRDAVMDFINDNGIENVLWVTGDIHMCFVGQVEDGVDTYAGRMWEICVTSGNTNPLAFTLPSSQFPWKSQDPHLPLITFDAQANEVEVTFVTTGGDIAHTQVLTLS